MAEITAEAYTDLRNHIQTDWKYIELVSDLDSAIVRLDATTDVRCTSTISGNNVVITVVVKGSDADITAPVTIAGSKIYDVATAGTSYSTETFTAFTIAGDQDELTVTHTIQVPQTV
ncbi:hypothetical protein BTO30_07090 [Domibacillus antri]|uniref:Uncharacterized protein n=1 Tax=Domibacillus antri TaxID=1714264 RepID=A0A1Q8Q6I2_9BACI|nr:hypothetical protein [Domibacillus antri]OLN22902.1 hypothetical protein BTO30_07090 [Domibacillus antri]